MRFLLRCALWSLLMLHIASSALAQDVDEPLLTASLLRAEVLTSNARHRPHALETPLALQALKNTPNDPWLGPDKVQHVTVSFLWTLGSQYTLVNKASMSERHALPLSIGSSALVGLSKELYDWQVGRHHYFSPRDLAADAVGIALAVTLILL